MSRNKIPSPSVEVRATMTSRPTVDPCEGMAKPAGGDASDSRHGLCGTVEAACECGLQPDHSGPHECQCGGSWTFDEEGQFVAVRLPGPFGGGDPWP